MFPSIEDSLLSCDRAMPVSVMAWVAVMDCASRIAASRDGLLSRRG